MLEAAAFRSGSLTTLTARLLLQLVPTPAAATKLSIARIETALRRAGRVRGIKESAAELHAILHRPHLRQDPLVEQAMGIQALRLLATLDAECVSVDQLAEACLEAFRQHPDYEVITSFPGLADLSGARVLAEIGDDRARFADARCLKAFAGSAPVTRASGRSTVVTHRRVKNDRLATAGFTWAFSALVGSPGAGPITTVAVPLETGTLPHSDTCSTGSWAASTTVSSTDPCTQRRLRSPSSNRSKPPLPLDS